MWDSFLFWSGRELTQLRNSDVKIRVRVIQDLLLTGILLCDQVGAKSGGFRHEERKW